MNSETQESTSLIDLLAWFEVNKKRLIMVATAVVVASLAMITYRWWSNQREFQANQALLKFQAARSGEDGVAFGKPDEYLKIAQDYSGTGAAERASFLAAGTLFTAEKYPEALAQFSKFLEQYGDSSLSAGANLGVAACLETQGKRDEALTRYQSVTTRYATRPESLQAKLAMARIYEEQNKPEQAYRLFEELARTASNTSWGGLAGLRKEQLLQRFPALATTVTNLAPANPAPIIKAGTAAPEPEKKK